MAIITSDIEKQQQEALKKALALQNSTAALGGNIQAQQLFNSKYGDLNNAAIGQYNAQEQLLNQSLTDTEAQNYQAFLKAQQNMSNRGLGDSGFADDAYTRLQMDNNRQYNTMRAQSAQNQANIFKQYSDDVTNSLRYDRQRQDQEDQLMADQTGYIYRDGSSTGQKTMKQQQMDWEHEQQRKAIEAQQAQQAFERSMANRQYAASQSANQAGLESEQRKAIDSYRGELYKQDKSSAKVKLDNAAKSLNAYISKNGYDDYAIKLEKAYKLAQNAYDSIQYDNYMSGAQFIIDPKTGQVSIAHNPSGTTISQPVKSNHGNPIISIPSSGTAKTKKAFR